MVDATALANNTALTLAGSATEVVTGLIGNINAASLTGALSVTTGDATDNTIAITTGSGATSISDKLQQRYRDGQCTGAGAEHDADAGRLGGRSGHRAGRQSQCRRPDRGAQRDHGRCDRQRLSPSPPVLGATSITCERQ